MQIFLAIAIVTFVGPLTGLAEQPSRSGPTSLEDANLLDQNRAELKITENPMKYLTLIDEKIGPVKYEMSNALSKLKASEFMNKIAKTNKKTFNQEINLSASFGGFTAESKTSFGLEASTNRESSDSKKLEEKISTGLKSTYTVPADQYYLQMAEMKLYVVNQNGKPNYIQMPTGKIKKGIYTYKWLQMFKKDKTFEYVYPMKKLTMYKVEDFVKAMPENLIKTVTASMGLPDEKKFYYIESARWKNIGLQAWTRGNNGQDVGCLPVSRIDSWMKSTRGMKTDWFKQWKFVPVPYKKGYYTIINRQFKNALYRGYDWGSWGATKIPDHGRTDEFQWKVKANRKYGGTVTIESAVKEEPMSTWSQVVGPDLENYNCGPQTNFDVVKSVSRKWWMFWISDRSAIFQSTHSVANDFFKNPYERRFAKLLLDFRVSSPTCCSSDNWKMKNKMHEFAKATQCPLPPTNCQKPTANDKLWKLKEVSVQWSGAQDKIWSDQQCRNLGNVDAGYNLDACKKKCIDTPSCTAINFKKTGGCALRRCGSPVPLPQWNYGEGLFQGYFILDNDDYKYVAFDNGPGCNNQDSITSPEECNTAAATIGFNDVNGMETISVSHAPPGCFVGHPSDGWSQVYFNTVAVGTTGKVIYRSICRKG